MMKRLIFIVLFSLSGLVLTAQEVMTDLDISKALVKDEITSVEDAFTKMGLTFQVIKARGKKTSLFVEGSKNNMKKWIVETKRGYAKHTRRVTSIEVSYDMENGGDFFDMKRYGKPQKKERINGRKVKFKLSKGKKESSLLVTAD